MATLTLDIESIAAGGDGVARHDGLVVFVPRSAPGDHVVVAVTQRGRLGRGSIVHVEQAGADRVEPDCVHYNADGCGGCQLQHLSLVAQRAAKGQIIADAFRRIGHRTVAAPEVRAGARAWRYRRKLSLALRRSSGAWTAGLRAHDDPDRIIPFTDCLITESRVVEIWHEILAASECLPDAHELRGSVLMLGAGTGAGIPGRASFTLEGASDWPRHAEFFDVVRSLDALSWMRAGGSRRLLHDRRTSSTAPSASFTQVNPEIAEALKSHVLATVRAYKPRSVIDAYSGSGDVAVALATSGAHVTAIELDADASRYCASRLPEGSRAIRGRVEDAMGGALPADVVILNPPRAGVDARVTAHLNTEHRAKAIVYVSCDPATLARDLNRMPEWRIASLTAFDMFPQTAHVETVCELVPVAAA